MEREAEWVPFDTPDLKKSRTGKEIKKLGLSTSEAIRLEVLLERIADGRAVPNKDFKHLKAEGLWEARFAAAKFEVRILYSPQQSRGTPKKLILVSLTAVKKKARKLPKETFATARQRLDRWRAGQRGV